MDQDYKLDSATPENIKALMDIGKNVTMDYRKEIQLVVR